VADFWVLFCGGASRGKGSVLSEGERGERE
jgi:hypothetical protein